MERLEPFPAKDGGAGSVPRSGGVRTSVGWRLGAGLEYSASVGRFSRFPVALAAPRSFCPSPLAAPWSVMLGRELFLN